jgi:hypothetical protein
MTQSPANTPTCAARGAGVFSFSLSTFSLSTSVVTFITYQEMAPAVNGTGPKRSAQILFMDKSDAQITMQGFELGMGWTLAIDRATGKAIITFANREEGILIFGAFAQQGREYLHSVKGLDHARRAGNRKFNWKLRE